MRRAVFAVLSLLLALAVLVFAIWPLDPAAPSTSPVVNVTAGQEPFARQLEIGLLYEHSGLLDGAQTAYEEAATSEQVEIVAAAQAGLERVLLRQRNPWLSMQGGLRTFLAWLAQNLLRLIVVGAAVWLIWLLTTRHPRRPGYLLLPFEDFTGEGLGQGLHALVNLILQEARRVHVEGQSDLLSSSERLELPLFGALSAGPEALGEASAALDSFSVGGIDLPLGQLLTAAQKWGSTREHVITGSLHHHGETIRLSAKVRRVAAAEALHTWELSAPTGERPAGQAAALAEELAFRILFALCPGLEAHTWRSLQLFTAALRESRRYGEEVMDRSPLTKAAGLLSQALVLDPGYTSARYLLGIVSSNLGRYPEARDAFREVIESGDRLNLEATYNLGLAFYHEFQDWANDQAIAQFTRVQEALSEEKRDERSKHLLALAHCGLAGAHAQRIEGSGEGTSDALPLVERHCRQAMTLASDREEIQAAVHNALGIAYLKAGQPEQAVGELKAAIRAHPGYAVPYVYLAEAYANTQPEEAIRWLEQAVKWHSGYEYAQFQLGKAYQRRGETEAAKRAYANAPTIPDARNSLGEILAQEGDHEDALTQFRQVVELNSRHARGWRNLAWWTVEAGKQDEASLQEATGCARRTLELDRGSRYEWLAHDVLGWVLFHRGRFDEAEQELRLSISAGAGEKQIQNRHHLACLYRQRGDLEEARQTLAEALQLEEPGYWRDLAVALMKELGSASSQEA